MAKLKQLNVIEIELPSIDGGFVKCKESFTVGDIEKIQNLETLKENKIASQLQLIITDWNLEDENGNKLEISVENINKLNIKDMMAVFTTLGLDKPKDFLGV